MADIQLPNNAVTGGIPTQWSQDILQAPEGLITGSEPAIMTEDLIYAAGQTIPAWTPVGFNASKELVPAVLGADEASTTVAIGITIIAIDTTGGAKGGPTYRSGCFNPDILNWPASYDTAAEKMAAFEGAPSPTTIIMRRRKTATVTLP